MAAESRGHVWGAAQVAYGAFGYLFPIARGPGRRYRKPNAVRSERNLRMVCGRAASSESGSLTMEAGISEGQAAMQVGRCRASSSRSRASHSALSMIMLAAD